MRNTMVNVIVSLLNIIISEHQVSYLGRGRGKEKVGQIMRVLVETLFLLTDCFLNTKYFPCMHAGDPPPHDW